MATETTTAEWDAATEAAREDWATDPHAHIERLITAGDKLMDALRGLPEWGYNEHMDLDYCGLCGKVKEHGHAPRCSWITIHGLVRQG